MNAREERRLVTALFCDLVGFTPLTERLDAEQIRSIQTLYFERMSKEIARFGGNVEKYMGDAVLALFGIPTTVGNDAEHAVLCALSMQEAMIPLATEVAGRHGVQLAIRVGVNTGEAVSGLVEAGGRRDYSVTGDVINTAARLQTAAEPGGIMVGAESMRLARKSVRFGERRDLALKGKAHTVVAYQVLGARTGGADQEKEDRNETPLVARDYELGILLHAWERAKDGEGHLVAVMGDAGIGKSRLLTEATERFSGGNSGRHLWGRCVSHGQGISLWLIADLIRSLTGTLIRDSQATAREELRRTVHALLDTAADDVCDTVTDVLGEVLGLPLENPSSFSDDPQVRRQQLIRSLRLILIGLSAQGPAVVVLEDLHWVDAASSEILAEVLADVPGLRLLILAAHRPGWTAPWAEWSWIERLSLRPLAQSEATTLAQTILGGSTLSSEFEQYVTERSGGNPYFVEELLHALREADGIAIQGNQVQLVRSAAEALPSTLTEILLARLDRLEDNVRDLVQAASVIGRGFSVPLLIEVSGWDERSVQEALAGLAGLDIVSRQPGSRSDYAFKHVTMRDVAYNTLLQARRHDLHARIARALAAANSADESVEIIAYHFAHSGEHAEAAIWLERAADHSSDVYANETAIGHYEEARRRLELVGEHDAAVRIGEKLGGIFRLVAWYDEALEEFETAAALYRRNGDLEGEAGLVAQIGQVHFLRGAPEEAIDSIRDVVGRLEGDVDDVVSSPGLAALYTALVDPLYSLNRFEDALTAAWRALELARLLDDSSLLVEATVHYGLALQGIGRLDEARLVLDEAISLAEAAGDQASLAEALMLSGDLCVAEGQPRQGAERYRRALGISEDRGDLSGTAALLSRLGYTSFILGDWNAAREQHEQTVELVRSISFSYFSASALVTLGEHYLREGEADKASRYLEEPFTLAERSGRLSQIPYLHVPLADWDLTQDRPEAALNRLGPLMAKAVFETPLDHRAMQIAAEAQLLMGNDVAAAEIIERGMEHAEGQGNALARLGWLQVAAVLAAHGNDEEKAFALLATALDLCRGMPHIYEEGRILYRRGLLSQSPTAREDLAMACAIFERLGSRPHVERVQRELAKVAVAQ